jgi:hypothetical protein
MIALKIIGAFGLWIVLAGAGMFGLVAAGIYLTPQGTAGALLVPWFWPMTAGGGVLAFWLVFRWRKLPNTPAG